MAVQVHEAVGNNIFRLHRPFFDLEPVTDAPLGSRVPLLDYENLDNEVVYRLGRYYTERFRFSLIAESGLSQYARLSPLEVEPAFRTPQWQRLCDLVEGFPKLTTAMQASVLYLLRALCFHRLILKLTSHINTTIGDENIATIALIHAGVHYSLYANESIYVQRLEEIIRQMPLSSQSRYSAAQALLISSARDRKDLSKVRRYRAIAQTYVDAPHHDHYSFAYYRLKSRFLRAASLEPFLAGDKERLIEEMDLAEELARTAPAQSETEHFVAQENLRSLLESRMREAVSLGNLDLAQARMEENIQINPWDAKVHIEMGEVCIRQGNLQRAAAEYTQAAHLSPPGGAVSRYMAGFCYEHLGAIEQAIECYLASLQIDPVGISPAQRLQRLAATTGKTELQHWAQEKLEQIGQADLSSQKDLSIAGRGFTFR